MRMRALAITLLLACEHGKGGGTGALVGGDCEVDSDCPTRLCWDFEEHDSLCSGKICSIECETSDDCIEAAAAAGSMSSSNAFCGSDGQCDLVGTGLGSFVCAVN
jgi:hypothetical protein